MKYFIVKKDGQIYNKGKFFILVKDELYTEKEVVRYGISLARLEPVDVSKRKVYWLFGARFEGTTTERLY